MPFVRKKVNKGSAGQSVLQDIRMAAETGGGRSDAETATSQAMSNDQGRGSKPGPLLFPVDS